MVHLLNLSFNSLSEKQAVQPLMQFTETMFIDTMFTEIVQRNGVAAQQKYGGKVTRACGISDEIELNFLNRPVVSHKVSGWGAVSLGG